MGYALGGLYDFVRTMKRLKNTNKGNFIVYMVCPERELSLSDILHRTFKAREEAGMGLLYRQADVFVSSSWTEGFALPPLEWSLHLNPFMRIVSHEMDNEQPVFTLCMSTFNPGMGNRRKRLAQPLIMLNQLHGWHTPIQTTGNRKPPLSCSFPTIVVAEEMLYS